MGFKRVFNSVVKIAVVDDQQLFREGIISLLKEHENLQVIIQAANGKQLFEQLKQQSPHIILLDIEMPEMNGIEATVRLRKEFPDIKIIILTMHNEEEFAFDLITKGAHGYLVKDRSVEEVINAIYDVIYYGRYTSEQTTTAIANGSAGLSKPLQLIASLTEKETIVLKMICEGKSTKEIAAEMNISVRTIDSHRNAVLTKTGAKNTASLVMYALQHKLIKGIHSIK